MNLIVIDIATALSPSGGLHHSMHLSAWLTVA